jgi:hypothetical protein
MDQRRHRNTPQAHGRVDRGQRPSGPTGVRLAQSWRRIAGSEGRSRRGRAAWSEDWHAGMW